MDKIINEARELLDRLKDKGLSNWEVDAVLDQAKLMADIRLHLEIDAMPANVSLKN